MVRRPTASSPWLYNDDTPVSATAADAATTRRDVVVGGGGGGEVGNRKLSFSGKKVGKRRSWFGTLVLVLLVTMGAFSVWNGLNPHAVHHQHKQPTSTAAAAAAADPPMLPPSAQKGPPPVLSKPDQAETGSWDYCQPDSTNTRSSHAVHNNNNDNKNDVVVSYDGYVTISCQTFGFKAPVEDLQTNDAPLIIGVLSHSQNGRNVIRQTWGNHQHQNTNYRVYFLVASTHYDTALQQEALQHNDLVWLHKEDHYQQVTYKVESFLVLVGHYAGPHLQHVLKTDQDSWVRVSSVLPSVRGHDYFGYCQQRREVLRDDNENHQNLPEAKKKFALSRQVYPYELFPPYCSGAGYALSRDFLIHCVMVHAPFVRFHPFEDVAVGMLAERCGYQPHHTRAVVRLEKDRRKTIQQLGGPQHILVHHHIGPTQMQQYYQDDKKESESKTQ